MAYQANGNIDWKFDANNGSKGYYCYDGSSPHAVTGIRASASCGAVNDYLYDNNGNMTKGRTGDIVYSAFDKPTRIDSATGRTDFAYGAGRSRYKRVDVQDGVTTTTYYAGNVEVVSKSDSNLLTYRRNLPGAIALSRSNGTNEISYLHQDHLGSLDTITNEAGEIKQKLYFDAWGKKVVLDSHMMLDVLQQTATPLSLTAVLDITPRGFTGHESVEHADIIHMNGRIYDPTLGRFLQADPHIQAPKNSQNYNRYSYVLNNPMSYTDPSGYFFNKLFKSINKALGKFAPIVAIGFAIIGQGWAAQGIWQAASIGFVSGGVATGSLKGALVGAFTAAAFSGIGDKFSQANCKSCFVKNAGKITDVLKTGARIGKIAAHAAVGGIGSVLNGGKFGHGFASAGFTQAFAPAIDGIDAGSRSSAGRITAAAVVGGTSSVITGGKFANGAVTGAFSRAFNDELHFKMNKPPTLVKENARPHGETYTRAELETLGVLEAGYKTISPPDLDSVNPASPWYKRLISRAGVAVSIADTLGTVDRTITTEYSLMSDKWEYSWDVYDSSGSFIGNKIEYDYHVNWTSAQPISVKQNFSNARYFWE